MERLAHEHRPKLIIAGASAYALRIDFERFARVAREVGALLHGRHGALRRTDRGGRLSEPGAPSRTWSPRTTHKSLRGPRGGIILMKAEHEKAINSAVFPGIQGGPLMHVIAAKAVAFKEALAPEFKTYQQQVVTQRRGAGRDAGRSAACASSSGRTESHVMLVDLRARSASPARRPRPCSARRTSRSTRTRSRTIREKPMVTSGIRLGTPAMTTRGFRRGRGTPDRPPHRRRAATRPRNPANIAAVREKVAALTARFPVYR